MSRTNIDLDDDAVAEVMSLYHLHTKREAVNFALNKLRRRTLSVDEIVALRGIGWSGDLEEMRNQPVEILDVDPKRLAELEKLLER
jgi:Arc/MetJ family transcription regulator